MNTVAILTADQFIGDRLRQGLAAAEFDVLLRVVRDEPDVSFRSLCLSDIIVCGYDVSRERVGRLLRALTSTGQSGRLVRVLPSGASRDAVLDSLGIGARGVVSADLIEEDRSSAVREVGGDRFFLSASLIPHVLERYRELCGELRGIGDAERQDASGWIRPFLR